MPPSTPTKTGFVKPADLFRSRRVRSTPVQSPLKCLSNSETMNSPIKRLPTLLRNPFESSMASPVNGNGQSTTTSMQPASSCSSLKSPVKRRLRLGENRSPKKSPKKRRMLELDEDANLEPPPMSKSATDTVSRRLSDISPNKHCDVAEDEWIVRTKLRIKFTTDCRNWSAHSSTTHQRLSLGQPYPVNGCEPEMRSAFDGVTHFSGLDPDSGVANACASTDNNISVEAIRNVCTYYQQPYFPWMRLYPRAASQLNDEDPVDKQMPPLNLTKHSTVANSIMRDWCDSLNDLLAMVCDGTCPYFYVCAEMYTMLFKQINVPGQKMRDVDALISATSYGMRSELTKRGIKFESSLLDGSTTHDLASVGSTNSVLLDTELGELVNRTPQVTSIRGGINDTSQHDRSISSSLNSCGTTGGDSAGDPLSITYGVELDENDETTQFLESIGLSQHDFPSLSRPSKRRLSDETTGGAGGAGAAQATMISVTGRSNCERLCDFLRTNRLYTMSNVGKFAHIPPTLLAPVQFRKCTPCYPDVTVSLLASSSAANNSGKQHSNSNPFKAATSSANKQVNNPPTFFELKGVILPSASRQLHKLLVLSNNSKYTIVAQSSDALAYR